MISAGRVQRQVLTNVQILRFIAAASILIKHSVYLFVPGSALLELPWAAGVDLFFVISGFIMAWLARGSFGQPQASGRFLLRRAIRIVPPYWFFTTLVILGLLIAPSYARNTTLTGTQAVTSYLFIPWLRPSDATFSPVLSQGWTLNYEAFFYVCFALALLSPRGLAMLALAFVGLSLAGPLIPPEWFVLRFYANPIILEFLGGLVLERLYHCGVRVPRWASSVLIAAGLAGLVLLPPFGGRALQFGLPALLIAAAFILAPEPKRAGPLRAMLSTGGDASYTLYLCHPLTCEAVWLVWALSGLPFPAAGALAAMIVSLAFAVLFYTFAERPLTEKLHGYFGFSRQREAQMIAP